MLTRGIGLSATVFAVCLGAAVPVAAAAPPPASTVAAASAVSPMTIHYIRSFFTLSECNQYGYTYFGDPRNWFCVHNSNPDLAPWALYADTSV